MCLQHPAELLGVPGPNNCPQQKSLPMFSRPSLDPTGDLNSRAMVMEMVTLAWFLTGDDGRAQSKENKVLMAKQAAVMGIPTRGRAAQFTNPTELRVVPQGGDGRRSCCDLLWIHPAWLWLRTEVWGTARWGMTARAKEIRG